MKKKTFYIIKSLILVALLSLIVLSEYGIPFLEHKSGNYINKGKLWNAVAQMPNAGPIVLNNNRNKKAVLIIHGYGGIPDNLKELAGKIHKNGYDVYIPLLPGHGTNINDFEKTTFEDFYNLVKKAYYDLRPKYSRLYGIGFSMGGSLLLRLNIEEKAKFKSLILISTPIMFGGYVRGSFVIKDIRFFFTGILRLIKKTIKLPAFSEQHKKMAPWRGYGTFKVIHHIHFFKINLRKIKKHCFKIKTPILLLTSPQDKEVILSNAKYILSHINSKIKILKLFKLPKNDPTNGHYIIVHKKVKDKLFLEIKRFLDNI